MSGPGCRVPRLRELKAWEGPLAHGICGDFLRQVTGVDPLAFCRLPVPSSPGFPTAACKARPGCSVTPTCSRRCSGEARVSGEGATVIVLVDFFLKFIGHFIVHIQF